MTYIEIDLDPAVNDYRELTAAEFEAGQRDSLFLPAADATPLWASDRYARPLTISVVDAETLGDLETEILVALDPPMNLAKVGKTPLRQQLSAVRKQYGSAAAKERGAE